MADVFHALADPTRRAILTMLSGRQLPAGVIAAHFPQRRPAISKHLTILKRAGLIDEARDRQRRLYSITPHAFEPVSGLIQALRPPGKERRFSAPGRPPESPIIIRGRRGTAPTAFDPETD